MAIRRLSLLSLVSTVLITGVGARADNAGDTQAGPADRPPSSGGVLILGDSISAAYGLDRSKGWVAMLEARLARDCPQIKVHNASVSGETSAGGLMRLPDLLDRYKPGLVVIELGGNDGLRGLSPARMRRNFEDMIKLSRAARAEVVMLGILIPPNYGETYRQLFERAIADAAEQAGVPFLDFFLSGVAEHPTLMQEDGIHPNEAAQPRLLDNALQVLDGALAALCGRSLYPSAR